jgi:hypothetical protein
MLKRGAGLDTMMGRREVCTVDTLPGSREGPRGESIAGYHNEERRLVLIPDWKARMEIDTIIGGKSFG